MMKILELYSGIGGMHMALKESGVHGDVVASIDINTVANKVYNNNFPDTTLLNQNIQGLTSSFINTLNVDTILMSPPCQPFTRNGLQNDVEDARTVSFKHILKLLPELHIDKVLIENVKGFESSHMRHILVETLTNNGFVYQEFILSPSQIGISNSRHRYYCLARRKPTNFLFETGPLLEKLPFQTSDVECFQIAEILDENIDKVKYLLSENVLKKRAKILDICHETSTRSCCFTKAYGRYVEGTGSVFTDKTEKDVRVTFRKLEGLDQDSAEYLHLLKALNLRLFSPKEICRLMCFPEWFSFPASTTDRQKYMVLGNSINVKVVAELIKLLI